MAIGTHDELAMEMQVHLGALAAIVQELVGGGAAHRRDGRWLRERAAAAGLDWHERAALEALRVRLGDGQAALLDILSLNKWL